MSAPNSARPESGGGERVLLEPWEELTGELYHLEDGDRFLAVHLSTGILIYDRESAAANRLRANFTGKTGAVVSVLRTESKTDPIRVDVRDSV